LRTEARTISDGANRDRTGDLLLAMTPLARHF
jgi:hypothetical protein